MLKIFRNLSKFDAFPKIDASHLRQTTPGGVATVIVSLLLAVLFLFEFYHYILPQISHEFVIDPIISANFPIKLDISIASACEDIMIQFIDPSGSAIIANKLLNAQGIDYYLAVNTTDPTGAQKKVQGCRISGSFPVDKNKGKIQITPLLHFRFHFDNKGAGIDVNVDDINFSHKIHKLSFGLDYPGMTNPLDNSNELANDAFFMYQYFISVIPTLYHDYTGMMYNSNQYAVTEYSRILDGTKSGSVGIFFNYSMEPILVHITNERQSFISFGVRLIGIIGGIFTCSGLLHHSITSLWYKYQPTTDNIQYSLIK